MMAPNAASHEGPNRYEISCRTAKVEGGKQNIGEKEKVVRGGTQKKTKSCAD